MSLFLQIIDDSLSELFSGGITTKIFSLHLTSLQHLVHALPDVLGVVVEAGVVQQVGRAQQHGRRVGHILAAGLGEGVTCSGLKYNTILKQYKCLHYGGRSTAFNFSFLNKTIFFIWAIFFRIVKVVSQKVVIKLPWTYKKLHCKRKTNRQTSCYFVNRIRLKIKSRTS